MSLWPLLPTLLLSLALLGGVATFVVMRQMSVRASAAPAPVDGSVYGFRVTSLTGDEMPLSSYGGQVSLVVNVASECGLAGQYQDIESLQQRFGPRGFTVLAFPSNDFLQEALDEAGIARMCQLRGYSYPMFARTHVRGSDQSPLYQFLSAATGETPVWNFGKYLIDRQGRPLAYFGPFVEPTDPELIAAIEQALAR
jgi:glutathione peroxidase